MAFLSGAQPNDGGGQQDNYWPMPKFYFSVDIGDFTDISFQEVTGLDIETDKVEYRHGNSSSHGTINMPGLMKYGDITFKRGVFADDVTFYELISAIQLNTFERVTIVIRLLDETEEPRMTWTCTNSFPKSMESTDLNSQSSDAAIESLVFSHEGLVQT